MWSTGGRRCCSSAVAARLPRRSSPQKNSPKIKNRLGWGRGSVASAGSRGVGRNEVSSLRVVPRARARARAPPGGPREAHPQPLPYSRKKWQ